MDDPARGVERGVLAGGLERGVAGEAVSWGPVRQQAPLPEERLRQVAPIQLRRQVLGVPSKELVPAPAQQDLVLRARPRRWCACDSRRLSRSPETSWDP